MAGQDYQGLTVRGGKYNFSTVKVLKGADGKPWGGYSVRIALDGDLKRIRDLFGGLVAGKTGYVYIIRPTDEKTIGQFVLHPAFQEKFVSEVDAPAAAKEVLASVIARKAGAFHYAMLDGSGRERERVVYAATSSGWGWTVATGSWLDEYLEESHALRNLLIVISAVAALILSVLVYVLVNARLRGLSQLVAEVAKVSAGDLRASARTPTLAVATRYTPLPTRSTRWQKACVIWSAVFPVLRPKSAVRQTNCRGLPTWLCRVPSRLPSRHRELPLR